MTYEKFRDLRKAILLLSIFFISLAPDPQGRLGMVDFSSVGIRAKHQKALEALREEEKKSRMGIGKVENREFEAIEDSYARYMGKFRFIIKYEEAERSKIEQIYQAEMKIEIRKFSEECKKLSNYTDIMEQSEELKGLYMGKIELKLAELYKTRSHNRILNILNKRIEKIIARELDSGYFLDFPEEDPDSYSNEIRHTAQTNASALEGTILGNIINRIINPRTALRREAKIYILELKKAIDAASSARLRHRVLTCGAYGEYYKIFLNE